MEKLWNDYFSDPRQYWDKRARKVSDCNSFSKDTQEAELM